MPASKNGQVLKLGVLGYRGFNTIIITPLAATIQLKHNNNKKTTTNKRNNRHFKEITAQV